MHIGTAALCDEAGEKARVCLAPWRSYGGKDCASGAVATLQIYEDAALLRHQLSSPGEGRVLVVDGGGSLRAAVLGENMARLGLENGWAGVLIFGAVRDVADLRTVELAIFALGSVPQRGGKLGAGICGGDLSIGGVVIRPGEFIVMDEDGIVVTASALAR